MAIEINDVKRVFKIEKTDIVLNDINQNMPLDEILNFYSSQYPQLITATVHGPEYEDDCVVYTFKTTVGTKG